MLWSAYISIDGSLRDHIMVLLVFARRLTNRRWTQTTQESLMKDHNWRVTYLDPGESGWKIPIVENCRTDSTTCGDLGDLELNQDIINKKVSIGYYFLFIVFWLS